MNNRKSNIGEVNGYVGSSGLVIWRFWLQITSQQSLRCTRSKDLSSSKSASGCTEKDEENAAIRDAYEAVPVVHCTALQLLRRNMELLQQERNH